jgi:hypothetical protein
MTRTGFEWMVRQGNKRPSHILGLGPGAGFDYDIRGDIGGVLFPVLSLIASRDVSCLIRRWAAVPIDHF